MKRNEFLPFIVKFGFIEITEIDAPLQWKRYTIEGEHDGIKRKFKFGQCYILFEDGDICISFNSPAYAFYSTDISVQEIQSLIYFLTIKANKKFTIKKNSPDICNIYKYFESKEKTLNTMSIKEQKRLKENAEEFNQILKLIKL
jgi:hypothetical protein